MSSYSNKILEYFLEIYIQKRLLFKYLHRFLVIPKTFMIIKRKFNLASYIKKNLKTFCNFSNPVRLSYIRSRGKINSKCKLENNLQIPF